MKRILGLTATAAMILPTGTACGGSSSKQPTVTFVVSAPVSTTPWVAEFEEHGAQLAADQLNAHGGITFAGKAHRVVIVVRDNGGSPQRAVGDARYAVSTHAAALITDGVGAAAVAGVTDPAGLPVFVVFDGGQSFINPRTHPTLFRIAPADTPMAERLADYLAGLHPKVALITDDTSFGTDGATALRAAFKRDRTPIVSQATVPVTAGDVSAQVLAARRAGATTLVVWTAAPLVAAAIDAARSSGWTVPIWAAPTGEDPLVRQRLAAHASWLTHVGFVSFRITAESGPAPFAAYRRAYVAHFGEDKVGVSQSGQAVVQPPDWSMFPYDSVNLVANALSHAGATGIPLLHTLEGHAVITGANGDERGFQASTREGVSPDDMYFATFHGFVFVPVRNDPLSQGLPFVPQTAS